MAKMTRAQEKAMFAGMNDGSGKRQRLSDSLQDVRQVTDINEITKLANIELRKPIITGSKLNKHSKIDSYIIEEINEFNHNANKLGLKIKRGQNVSFIYLNNNSKIYKEDNVWKYKDGITNKIDIIDNPDEWIHDSSIRNFIKSKDDKKVIVFLNIF